MPSEDGKTAAFLQTSARLEFAKGDSAHFDPFRTIEVHFGNSQRRAANPAGGESTGTSSKHFEQHFEQRFEQLGWHRFGRDRTMGRMRNPIRALALLVLSLSVPVEARAAEPREVGPHPCRVPGYDQDVLCATYPGWENRATR